ALHHAACAAVRIVLPPRSRRRVPTHGAPGRDGEREQCMTQQTGTAPRAGTGSKGMPQVSGEEFSTLINLSGRRRFTSQRVVLFAVLAAQGREGALAASEEAL